MKAIEITSPGNARLIEKDIPEIKSGYVLLKVKYAGFCGSDLNTFRGLNPLVKMPVIPGHEIGAQIEEVGEGVPGNFRKGMSVTVNPYTNCGKCPACLNARYNACEFNETLGVQRDGAMSEYISIPWQKVIPDEVLTFEALALVEPMSVGFHAVDRAMVSDIDNVIVFGCGMIGVGAIVRAALRGANVIAVDIDDKKLEMSRKLGAAFTINSLKENVHEQVQAFTQGRGGDVVIEAVGRPETYTASVAEAAFTGRVVYIGYAKEKIPFETQYFVKKELNIMGSRNALPADFKAVIKYLSKGICPVKELISAIYPPEQAQHALEKWMENPGDIFRIYIQF